MKKKTKKKTKKKKIKKLPRTVKNIEVFANSKAGHRWAGFGF